MRVRPRFLPLCLVPFVTACANGSPEEQLGRTQQGLGGIEGSMEAALDAPWRIEPSTNADGTLSYGQIPIQISIHDANLAALDSGRYDYSSGEVTYVPTTPRLGKFCELVVEENNGTIRTHKSFNNLIEVEATTGSWTPNGAPPPHQVCKPWTGTCAALQDVGPTSEWHAGAWFTPSGAMTPGRDIPLTLKARLTRNPATACTSTNDKDFLTITNHVKVHLGEAPLPRFDNGWLYGDLHYHAQGTDNEGEVGYHNRGVVRALGALGVDFVFATDHASSSEQVVDGDVNVYPFVVELESTGGVLRDMNDARFRMLHNELWKTGGANYEALVGPGNGYPQGYKSHGVVPRVFLGGEVDVIGEIGKGWDGKGYSFGNGLRFDLDRLCEGWFTHWATWDGSCETSKLRHDAGDAILFKDVQGVHDYGFTRAHMVYLPKSQADAGAFVGSFTGKYGGGARRMTQTFNGREGLLPEVERKGYAFLAHHVPGGACPNKNYGGLQSNGASLMTDLNGGKGPDAAPYTETMLAQAFQSPAVLGLEFWNEDTRLCTEIGKGDAKELGYNAPGDFEVKKLERYGYQTGQFELAPWYQKANQSFQHATTATEWTLHHGAASWDRMLRDGIDPAMTGALGWLPAGEPRRVFMGGGSDAHGDFNYRREGYMFGTTEITDTAIAKVRNLIYAGAPDVPKPELSAPVTTVFSTSKSTTTTTSKTLDGAATSADTLVFDPGYTPPPTPHTQEEVVGAMKEGNFSITDGPALRLVIDKNRNGVVDAGDTPMGGIVELNGESTLPVLVEWMSTPEFGAVNDIQLYVGVQSGGGADDRYARTYAVSGHGPRAEGIASSDVDYTYTSSGRTYSRMKDGYWADPTGALRIVPGPGLSGTRRIDLPIAAFQTANGRTPERIYVRAFAATQPKDAWACANNDVAKRSGACIRRYAFTNPVWAMPAPKSPTGTCLSSRPRAMDRDGDGIPDGCDACPDTSKPLCYTLPLGGVFTLK